MKDIQEIMKEMGNLRKEIAVTTETEQKNIELSNTGSDPVLGTACCLVNVPTEFTLPTFDPITGIFPIVNQRLSFSLANLRAIVTQIDVTFTAADCPNATITGTAFEVRLVGCIPYIANLDNVIGTCNSAGSVSVCCINKFCVDHRIAIFATQRLANAFIAANPNLLTCANITAGLTVTLVAPRPEVITPPIAAIPAICPDSNTLSFQVTFNSLAGNCL